MSAGRVVSTLLSCAAVAGCAVVVVGMTRANTGPVSDDRAAAATTSEAPAYEPQLDAQPVAPAVTSATPATPSTGAPASTSAPAAARPATSTVPQVAPAIPATTPATIPATVPATKAATVPAGRVAAPRAAAPRTTAPRRTTPPPARTTALPAPRPAAKPAGQSLPLRYGTGTATRVVTVTAGSSRSTTATLQAWSKLSNGRWQKYGSAVKAYVGSDGIGSASETRSKTPAGSWTITQAFGRYANPGTKLGYVRTTPSDYWISSPGKLYNTRQRCSSCGYNNGVNERLYYVNPQYNYAAVIDYNTRNAPGGVKPGRGSAFFLHVSSGEATAGCVAIPQSRLTSLLRWLTPTSRPRILIGVT